MVKVNSITAALLVTALLSGMAGCGAVLVGGGAAAIGTYAYVNGQAQGTYSTDVATAYTAAQTACKELGIPITRESKSATSAEIQGKLSGDRVTISLKLVGDSITEISVRVGLWGNEDASRRIHNLISQRL